MSDNVEVIILVAVGCFASGARPKIETKKDALALLLESAETLRKRIADEEAR